MIRVGWMAADAERCLPFTRSLLSFDPKPPNIKFSSSKVHLEHSLSRTWVEPEQPLAEANPCKICLGKDPGVQEIMSSKMKVASQHWTDWTDCDNVPNKTKDIFTLLRLKRFLYMIVGCSIPCRVVLAHLYSVPERYCSSLDCTDWLVFEFVYWNIWILFHSLTFIGTRLKSHWCS